MGLILLVYGLIIVVSGLVYPQTQVKRWDLHPAIWWGVLMLVGGGVFLGVGLKGRKGGA